MASEDILILSYSDMSIDEPELNAQPISKDQLKQGLGRSQLEQQNQPEKKRKLGLPKLMTLEFSNEIKEAMAEQLAKVSE